MKIFKMNDPWNGVPNDPEEPGWHLLRFYYEGKPKDINVEMAWFWEPSPVDWCEEEKGKWVLHTFHSIETVWASGMVKMSKSKEGCFPPDYLGELLLHNK